MNNASEAGPTHLAVMADAPLHRWDRFVAVLSPTSSGKSDSTGGGPSAWWATWKTRTANCKPTPRRWPNLATTEERNRLARDIHDSLGHYLTVINVQLEKASLFVSATPPRPTRAVRDSKRFASEALQEVRRSVSALRSAPEPFSLAESLRQLVDDARTGHFTINLDISGDECGYSRQSLLTLYRAAQEGLTNVQKHAQASQVTLRLQLNGGRPACPSATTVAVLTRPA